MSGVARTAERLSSGLFYGWYIAGAGATTNFIVGGITSFGFAVFISPIQDSTGWGAAVITIGYSIRAFEAGLMAPFTGILVDRVGPRRMAILGIFVTASGVLLFSQAHEVWVFYVSSLVIALGQSVGGFVAFSSAVMRWFHHKRGRAMGILTAGNGAGYLMAPVLAVLITSIGWRGTLVIAAFAIIAMGIPLAMVLRDRPEPYGYHPDGEAPPEDPAVPSGEELRAPPPSDTGMTVSEALHTPAMYLLMIAIALAGPTQNVFIILNISHMQNVGFSALGAAFVVGIYGVVQVILRPFGGWAADIIGRRRTYLATFLLQGVGLILFANLTDGRLWILPLFYLTYAVGHGMYVVLFMTMTADYFGARRFATLRGVTMTLQMPFGMVLPIIAASVFDATGSYRVIFMIYALVASFGALMVALIRRPTWGELQKQQAEGHPRE